MKNVRRWRLISRYAYEVMKLGRLHLWPIAFLTLLAGAASYTTLNCSTVLQIIPLSFLISYVSFAPNDYFDFDIDRDNHRKEAIGLKISDKGVAKAAIFASVFASLAAASLMYGVARISILGVLTCSIAYSVPPFRFKGRAPLDSLCNVLGVFFIFALGVGVAGGSFSDIVPGAYWFSVIIGAGAHAILAIPDMESDRKEDLRTMPMLLGPRNTVILVQAFMAAAMILEDFSLLTSTFLASSLIGLTYFWKERTKEELVRYIAAGVIISTLYLTIYTVTRGVI